MAYQNRDWDEHSKRADERTDRRTDKQTDSRTDERRKPADEQTDGKTDRQTDRSQRLGREARLVFGRTPCQCLQSICMWVRELSNQLIALFFIHSWFPLCLRVVGPISQSPELHNSFTRFAPFIVY